MWNLPLPQKTAREAFLLCISNVQDDTKKTRLTNISDAIEEAEKQYKIHAAGGNFHLFPKTPNGARDVTRQELISLYDDKLAKQGQPGRPIYDELRLSAPGQICPLCGYGKVSTLDHYLPKAEYSVLAVTPCNLVPACKDCNGTKLQASPAHKEENWLHPYYDLIDTHVWLMATVLEVAPAALIFNVAPRKDWDNALALRVQKQFNDLKLDERYAEQAGEEMRSISQFLKGLHADAGPTGVMQFLAEMAASQSAHRPNGWRAATYTALASNDWYCRTGFNSFD